VCESKVSTPCTLASKFEISHGSPSSSSPPAGSAALLSEVSILHSLHCDSSTWARALCSSNVTLHVTALGELAPRLIP